MKNSRLIKRLAAIAILALTTVVCKKSFLDRNPLDSYTNDVLWHSSNDALTALNGWYSIWCKGYNGYSGTFSDCTTANAFAQCACQFWLAVSVGIATPTNAAYLK